MIEYDKHIEYSIHIINTSKNVYFNRPRMCGSSTFLRWYTIKYCIEHENVRCIFYNMNSSTNLLDHNIVKTYFSKYINKYNKKHNDFISYINTNYIGFTNSSEIECYKKLQYSLPSNTYDLIIFDDIQYILSKDNDIDIFINQLLNVDTRKRPLKLIMLDSCENVYSETYLKLCHYFKRHNISLTTDVMDMKELENITIACRRKKITEIFN